MHFFISILGKTIWEILQGMLFKMAWSVMAERFVTRLIIWGLEVLKSFTSNDVAQSTVDDIILSLQGKRLKEVPLIQEKKET
ncbi:hypothetical protein [Psychromonas ossibalaenae]|uniref:hypothetical protein n=1 Tax=Psychromonas ossibalaenae TaxID=444922 RepID=UPI000378777D|nr:hypothetical protein [Psychromonas ossibalaenae]